MLFFFNVILLLFLYRYKTEFSAGIGPVKFKAIRVGMMGINAKPEVIDYALKVLVESIEYLRVNKVEAKTAKLVI